MFLIDVAIELSFGGVPSGTRDALEWPGVVPTMMTGRSQLVLGDREGGA